MKKCDLQYQSSEETHQVQRASSSWDPSRQTVHPSIRPHIVQWDKSYFTSGLRNKGGKYFAPCDELQSKIFSTRRYTGGSFFSPSTLSSELLSIHAGSTLHSLFTSPSPSSSPSVWRRRAPRLNKANPPRWAEHTLTHTHTDENKKWLLCRSVLVEILMLNLLWTLKLGTINPRELTERNPVQVLIKNKEWQHSPPLVLYIDYYIITRWLFMDPRSDHMTEPVAHQVTSHLSSNHSLLAHISYTYSIKSPK